MPLRDLESTLPPDHRRDQVTAILAKGVIRWLRGAKSAAIIDAQESSLSRETSLDLPGETSLTVSDGTRGFTLRVDGDNA